MDWMIVVPVAIVAGCFGAWLRSLSFDPEIKISTELGLVFAGIVFAGLAVAVCYIVSIVAAGVSFSLAWLIAFMVLLAIAALFVVAGALMGSFGATVMAVLMLGAFTSVILSDNRVEALDNERASLGAGNETRTVEVSCAGFDGNSASIVTVGREAEGGFEIEGYRYLVRTGGERGVADFTISTAQGRYSTSIARESNLVANGQWQSRQANGGGIASGQQARLSLTLRFAGRNEMTCSVPVAF